MQRATPDHGWVIVAFKSEARRPGHRPILEQALDARDRPIATKRNNPWEYGGTEPALPPLEGPGSIQLAAVRGRPVLRLVDDRAIAILGRAPLGLDLRLFHAGKYLVEVEARLVGVRLRELGRRIPRGFTRVARR